MVLALPEEFFEGWEWKEGDKLLINAGVKEYQDWIIDIIGNIQIYCGKLYHVLDRNVFDLNNEIKWTALKNKVRPFPSQEQLQEKCMSLINCDAHDLLRFFEAWIYEDEIRPVVRFADFNDLWLKYTIWVWVRKEWNGDAWI